MLPGRPKTYKNPTSFPLYCDVKDRNYLDDHRGSLSRTEFILEKMYNNKNNDSRIVSLLIENKKLKQENQELKRQLLFIQHTSKKQPIDNDFKQTEFETFYITNDFDAKLKSPIGIVWDNFFDKHRAELVFIGVNTPKELQTHSMELFKKNQELIT